MRAAGSGAECHDRTGIRFAIIEALRGTPKMLGGTILLVDDDEAVLTTLSAVLRGSGHSVTQAGDAEAALAELARAEFDIVLTDLRLGESNGLMILEAVGQQWPDTVTLMLTGHSSTESAISALRAGAYDYLEKPCSIDELLATVDRALERRRLTLQVRRQLQDLHTAIDTARELHSALSTRVEGTRALLREREHVIVTISNELKTSLIAIGSLLDVVGARVRATDTPLPPEELMRYIDSFRSELLSLVERVNAGLRVVHSESVEMGQTAGRAEISEISLEAIGL